MQVNSAQDYLTQIKRQIIAKSLAQSPPPLKQRTNTQYIGILANKSDRYDIFVGGVGINTVGPATLGKAYTSFCCVPANTSTRTYLV
jgi:hypothetical protein